MSESGSGSLALCLRPAVYDFPNGIEPMVLFSRHFAAKGFTKLLFKVLPGNLVIHVRERIQMQIQQLALVSIRDNILEGWEREVTFVTRDLRTTMDNLGRRLTFEQCRGRVDDCHELLKMITPPDRAL